MRAPRIEDPHRCAAVGCNAEVKRSLFCQHHWHSVPRYLQKALFDTTQSTLAVEALEKARHAIAVREGLRAA